MGETFSRTGVVVLEDVVEAGVIARARAALPEIRDTLEQAASLRGTSLDAVRSAEVVARPGVLDIRYGVDRAPLNDPALRSPGALPVLLRELLGPDAAELYAGVLIGQVGSLGIPAHSDGEILFPGFPLPLPPHCVTVMTALSPITLSDGPTRFYLGTHLRPRRPEDRPVPLPLRAGSVCVFDYRLVHEGSPNLGGRERELFYMTWSRAWFRDVLNFPQASLMAPLGGEGID